MSRAALATLLALLLAAPAAGQAPVSPLAPPALGTAGMRARATVGRTAPPSPTAALTPAWLRGRSESYVHVALLSFYAAASVADARTTFQADRRIAVYEANFLLARHDGRPSKPKVILAKVGLGIGAEVLHRRWPVLADGVLFAAGLSSLLAAAHNSRVGR